MQGWRHVIDARIRQCLWEITPLICVFGVVIMQAEPMGSCRNLQTKRGATTRIVESVSLYSVGLDGRKGGL